MPRYNGTGPSGRGAMTGWGAGPCCTAGSRAERGFGRFWRGGYQLSEQEEKEILENEVNLLEEDLKLAKSRLVEIKGQK